MAAPMKFWGVVVKSGEPILIKPGFETYLHLSQACLGEFKNDKGSADVNLYVNDGNKKIVLGRLSEDELPQLLFDAVFTKDFELSHDWKKGCVHFCGYKSTMEEEPESQAKPVAEMATASKSDSTSAKQKVKIAKPKKEDETSTEYDESDAKDKVVTNGGGMRDDEDEETPKNVQVVKSKKRPIESATRTPASEKKAKFVTLQKSDGKKGAVHVTTPFPSKHVKETSGNNGQVNKQQNSNSSGAFSCKSCNRSFKTDQALHAHSEAKHIAAT